MRVLALTNMYPTPERPGFGTFVEDQVESLRKAGVEVDVLFVDGSRHRMNYLLGFPRLWARMARCRYDLIHAHYIFSGMIARGQVSCPVVLTHPGPEVFRTWQATLCRRFTPWFDRVIVVSNEMKTRLGYRQARIIPYGVDPTVFYPRNRIECRKELGIREDADVVLWAGDYRRPEKRYGLVTETVAILTRRRPRAELLTFTDRPHAELPGFMGAADVLLLASDAEGSPMVVKEALACGVPVVSTAVGDVAEAIDRIPGCSLSPQDPTELARHLEEALDFGLTNPERRGVVRHEMNRISERIIEVYREVVSPGSRGAGEGTS
jgi:glycosyltransferase involved in cell wall biosynthesis